jgi:hypothetical protein
MTIGRMKKSVSSAERENSYSWFDIVTAKPSVIISLVVNNM